MCSEPWYTTHVNAGFLPAEAIREIIDGAAFGRGAARGSSAALHGSASAQSASALSDGAVSANDAAGYAVPAVRVGAVTPAQPRR
jgi:hypothetical protein